MKEDREYRSMELMAPEENSYKVEGYASTFLPYTLFVNEDGIEIKEQIMPDAFEGADMSDVVFRVDHAGRVYARSSAGTIELFTDEHGLGQRTDLSRTQGARDLYEDIAAGNYPKMSFAFRVAEDHYDKATHTRIIDRIAKVFDISPVSFPANPTTELSVSTRSFLEGVIKEELAERLTEEKRIKQRQRIKILSEV